MTTTSRRTVLADAGLCVLASEGARGLTHRAVDAQAELPPGSCSNAFRTRDQLLGALADRIVERLTPSAPEASQAAKVPPSRDRWVELMVELVDRAKAEPELSIAFLELRLESTRRPRLRPVLSAVVQASLEGDIAFHHEAGLAGGRHEIVLLHLAIGGLITEVLTLPDGLGIADTESTIAELVDRLVFPPGCGSARGTAVS